MAARQRPPVNALMLACSAAAVQPGRGPAGAPSHGGSAAGQALALA